MDPAAEALREWHEFFVYVGTIAGTLVGAMFVVVSIGVGFLTRERSGEIREFVTPTVVHLATVILVSAVPLVPALDGWERAGALAVGAVFGLAYSASVGLRVRRRGLGVIDLLWYGATPLLGYSALWLAAVLAAADAVAGPKVLALAVAILLVASLRNAWDLILFIVTRPR
ncbi:MAG TPA: hypothetical protein VMG55_01025 [Stellaceae bacterium]|nr:hypothetical protein [Stellaceae bacterium]